MLEGNKYKIFCINLQDLDSKEKQTYRILTEPKYRVCLDGLDPYKISDSVIIAVGVTFEKKIVALSLASVHPKVQIGDLFSLNIDKNHQSLSLGLDLLKYCEKECKKKGAEVLSFHYRKGDKSAPFLEEIFQECRWTIPKLFMYRLFFDALNFYPSWYDHPPKMPDSFSVFPWTELQEKERAKLYFGLKRRAFSPSISPFFEEEKIEPINSLGVRYQDEVIGWAIAHRIAHDTIRYTSLYIKPEFQFLGYSITLLVKSIKLQQQSNVRWALFEVNVNKVEKSWLTFVKKRLTPYTINVDILYQTWKSL